MKKKILVAFTIVFFSMVVIWQATPLRVWWSIRQLRQAAPDERAACAERFAPLGESAVGPLLDGWKGDDAETCGAHELALRAVAAAWTIDDAALERTLDAVSRGFAGFSREGKNAALRWTADIAANRGRDLALTALADAETSTRIAAVQVLLREPLAHERDVLLRLLPLLRDAEPGVRKLALIAVGSERDIASEEHLMPLLHDDDAEVRRLCEMTLRSRGLSDDHLRLARLIGDPDPSVRIQVLSLLRQSTDLDGEVWLRRMTQDGAPAIRAAAARAAGSMVPLRSRLSEMAQSDPSETVRGIAQFWLDRSAVRRTSGD